MLTPKLTPVSHVYKSLVDDFSVLRCLGKYENKHYFKYFDQPISHKIDQIATKILQYEPTQAVVRPTLENVTLAIKGFDHGLTLPENELWELAKLYLKEYISMYIPRHYPQYTGLEMDYSRSCGFPWNLYFKTKGDIPDWLISQAIFDDLDSVIWSLSMKRETLPIEKILKDNKMRSFMMPPIHYLILQKIFSTRFNHFMKKVPMSAYGFNYHKMGFHEMCKHISEHKNIIEYDVKYWDKNFGLKKICKDIRKEFLILTPEEDKLYERMRIYEEQPTVLLPDGSLVQLKSGQCSGSEDTTSDNTLAHILIFFYEALVGAKEKFGKIVTLNHILKNTRAKMYSDDNISSCSDDFDFMANGEKKHFIFSQFGMGIEYNNPEKWQVSKNIIGHHFLGLKVGYFDDAFVFLFDYDKIKDSSVINMDDLSPSERIPGFVSLLSLLVFTPHYNEYRKFIIEYCNANGLEVPYILSRSMAIRYELNREARVGEVEENE